MQLAAQSSPSRSSFSYETEAAGRVFCNAMQCNAIAIWQMAAAAVYASSTSVVVCWWMGRCHMHRCCCVHVSACVLYDLRCPCWVRKSCCSYKLQQTGCSPYCKAAGCNGWRPLFTVLMRLRPAPFEPQDPLRMLQQSRCPRRQILTGAPPHLSEKAFSLCYGSGLMCHICRNLADEIGCCCCGSLVQLGTSAKLSPRFV